MFVRPFGSSEPLVGCQDDGIMMIHTMGWARRGPWNHNAPRFRTSMFLISWYMTLVRGLGWGTAPLRVFLVYCRSSTTRRPL